MRLGSVFDHLPREAQAALLAHVRKSCGCSEDDALPLHVKGDVFGAARGLPCFGEWPVRLRCCAAPASGTIVALPAPGAVVEVLKFDKPSLWLRALGTTASGDCGGGSVIHAPVDAVVSYAAADQRSMSTPSAAMALHT